MSGQVDAAARVRRNRELIAERLGWPDDALIACLAIEQEYPQWAVYWDNGQLPASPGRGYRAFALVRNRSYQAFGETPEQLVEALTGRRQD